MMYVSLEDAKAQCRVDHNSEDAKIVGHIEGASSMVKNYLKSVSPYEPERDAIDSPIYDSNGTTTDDESIDDIRYEVKSAVLILVSMLYDETYEFTPGSLPPAVQAILYPLRIPTLA